MPDTKPRCFVVLDIDKARLLRLSRTDRGSAHVDETASLASTFAAGEHHRPDRMGAPGRSAGTGNEHDEKLHHFARQLAPWLGKELATHGVTTCPLFAPAHMLGALKKELDRALAGKLELHDVELTGLSNGQLATHPRVQALLPK